MLLLAASCFFYISFVPIFILILAFTITVDYFAGLAIEGAVGKRKLHYLIASIVANVGVLFVFKYFDFFNQNLSALADFLHWNYSLETLALILPIGLSFHTFQSLSYTIEVYRGKQKAERHLGIFALYVMFYPQLVAGPIERPQNLLHQFRERHTVEIERISSGLALMLYGFFKKLVIADNLAPFVNLVYAAPDGYSGIALLIATIFFAFQIYCDFSGYSDIAIGSARVMGFNLMRNFNHPYFSRSIGEFWRRWHRSLSTWFRDYVYIPLGGSRVPTTLLVRNIFITFLLSGFWHGANWTYVIWGALNGGFLAAAHLTRNIRPPLPNNKIFGILRALFQTLFTFALICLAWVYFRAETLVDANMIVGKILTDWYTVGEQFATSSFLASQIFLGGSPYDFYWCLVVIGILLGAEALQEYGRMPKIFSRERPKTTALLTWFVVATALLLIIVLSRSDSSQFIYFQF